MRESLAAVSEFRWFSPTEQRAGISLCHQSAACKSMAATAVAKQPGKAALYVKTPNAACEVDLVSGAGLLMRKDVFGHVGGRRS